MDISWHLVSAAGAFGLDWLNSGEPINGFADREEFISKIKNPLVDLTVIILVSENYMRQYYYPEDILSFEIHAPQWKLDECAENIMKCHVGIGTTMRISPLANEWDKFGEGHSDIINVKEQRYMYSLFKRIIIMQDFVDIIFGYDADFWQWFEHKKPYEDLINPKHPKKYLHFAVPCNLAECTVPIDDSGYGIDENPLQKSYLEENGVLNISWRCPNREHGLCDGKNEDCYGW